MAHDEHEPLGTADTQSFAMKEQFAHLWWLKRRYLMTVVNGIAVQATGGVPRSDLKDVAELGLRNLPLTSWDPSPPVCSTGTTVTATERLRPLAASLSTPRRSASTSTPLVSTTSRPSSRDLTRASSATSRL